MAGRLRPQGRLVLDVYHRGFFERHSGERSLERAGGSMRERSDLRGNRLRVWLDDRDVFDWRLFTPQELVAEAQEAGLESRVACTTWDESRPPSPKEARMQLVFERVHQQERPSGFREAPDWYDSSLHTREGCMARRTIHIPGGTEELVQELALEGESFSATATRLIEAGAKALSRGRKPSYVATGDGPDDLGRRAEMYLRDTVTSE